MSRGDQETTLAATKDDIKLEIIESEEEDYESSPAEYEIATFPADFTLQGLHDKWKAGDIEIPKFQRQFVWKDSQASKLIESFVVGLPVPPVFFYTERKSQKYLVIDGQQRLRSIFYFFEGYFGEEVKGKKQVFRLTGLNKKSKWAKKVFTDFEEADQRRLKNSVLRSFVVQQLDPEDDTSIYHIFERLNTGGTLLTNQEIRNCVHQGSLNDLLKKLNIELNWRSILGKPKPDSRQKDIELILRFFGLQNPQAYEKPLKDYLTKFLRRHRNPEPAVLAQMKGLFLKTCDVINSRLGAKPFHIRAGLNSAVYDSVMVAFSKHLAKIPSDVKGRYSTLVKNDAFYKLSSSGTTDEETIRKRLSLANKILFGN